MIDENTVLLALNTKEKLFHTLHEILETSKRCRIFIEIKKGLSQRDIADKANVGQATVSRTINDLIEIGLVTELEEGGYRKTLRCMDHPLMEHLWWEAVIEDEGE